MKRFPSIHSNQEFRAVYEKGSSKADRNLVIYLLKNGTDKTRLGISASKKVGNSVVRHRMARLLREAFRLNLSETETGYDIVAVVRPAAKDAGFREIERSYLKNLSRHGIFVPAGRADKTSGISGRATEGSEES